MQTLTCGLQCDTLDTLQVQPSWGGQPPWEAGRELIITQALFNYVVTQASKEEVQRHGQGRVRDKQ